MKTLKTFLPAIIALGLTLVWHACTKKDHTDPDDFFEKQDDLAFFKAANGNLAKVDFLNRTIDRFKILDQSQHFAGKLQSWYGDAKWNMTIVVNNKDGLYTLITPFVNDRDTVTALLFAYHTDQGSTTIYRLYNKENYKRYFDYTGSKDATTINRSTVEGWFGLFSKTHQRLKNVQEGKTLPRTIFYEWECIRYTWTTGSATDGSTGFGMSDWQCTMNIHDDGNNGGGHIGELESTLEEPEQCGGQPCPGGGPVTTWTYTEIPTANFSIIDSLKGYPCAQNLLGNIGSLNDSISKLINATFGKSDVYNLIFVPRSNEDLGASNGGTIDGRFLSAEKIWPSETSDQYQVNYTVGINTDVLNNATQEYILVTMYHEALHAYLSYENVQMGDSLFNATYPKIKSYDVVSPNGKRTRKFDLIDDHERFGMFIGLLEQSLKSFNKNMPPDRVTAMARMGIIDPSAVTNDQKLLNGYERNIAEGNSVGTKCRPTVNQR